MQLLKNPIVILVLILSVLGALGGIYAAGYSHGHEKATSKAEIEKKDTINGNIKIKQKQDRVTRPSDSDYRRRLLEKSL
jgi:disulfide bond formation protein DsbB